MLCGLGLHRTGARAVWNAGIGFSTCAHCGREIIRRPGRPWARVPRGYVVVWRPVRPDQKTGEHRDWSKPASWIADAASEPHPPNMAEMLEAITAQPPFTDMISSLSPLPAAATLAPAPDATAEIPADPPREPVERAHPPQPSRHAARIRTTLSLLRHRIARRLARPVIAREPASRGFRHLARRIGAAQPGGKRIASILLSAVCDAGTANDTMLMFAAMLQDELGGRLLVVDATLRADGTSSALGLSAVPGLSDVRDNDPHGALELIQLLPRPSIFLMPAGLNPGAVNPNDFPALLPALSAHFDHILIQQHAIFSDTRYLPIAAGADLVIVLAEEGQSRMPDLARCRETFRANAIGQVGMLLALPPTDPTA